MESQGRWHDAIPEGALTSAIVALVSYVLTQPAPMAIATRNNRMMLGALLLATGIFVALIRGSVDQRRLLASAGGFLYSLSAVTLITVHLIVLATFPFQSGFIYDFRFYSLILFGGVVLLPSVRCLTATIRLARGNAEASRDLWVPLLMLIALNIPLIPLQDFATLFSVGGALNLMLLWSIGERPRSRHSASQSTKRH